MSVLWRVVPRLLTWARANTPYHDGIYPFLEHTCYYIPNENGVFLSMDRSLHAHIYYLSTYIIIYYFPASTWTNTSPNLRYNFCSIYSLLIGSSQPLTCFWLHPGTPDKLNSSKEAPKGATSSRGTVRLSVEWFLSRENNRWLGWKRFT